MEEVKLQHEGHRLDAAGALYIPLRDHEKLNPITPLQLWIDTAGNKRNLPAENRFEDTLKRERLEAAEGEEAPREADEELVTGATAEGTTRRTALVPHWSFCVTWVAVNGKTRRRHLLDLLRRTWICNLGVSR